VNLADRRAPLFAALLGTVLALPALRTGFFVDDWLHRLKIEGARGWEADVHPALELFSFMAPGKTNDLLIAQGILPWYTHPEVRAALFRPLSSATHLLDWQLFGDFAPAHHLHNLGWWFLGALMVGLVLRRSIGGTAAGLAALLFAVEDAHAMPIAWVANRNALLCLAFGAAAVWTHLRWREGRGPLALPLALASVGLLAGEATLGALAYIVAWQLTEERPWRERLLPIAPYAALVVAWRLVYSGLGYGASGSGLYIDPARQPLDFLQALVERGPILMLTQTFQVPVDLWILMPREAHLALTAAGLATCALLTWLFYPLRHDRRARFLALGMGGSLVPLCAAFPMDRLLVFAGIGFFGLLALRWEHERGKVIGLLMLLAGPWSALVLPLRAGTVDLMMRGLVETALASHPPGPSAPEETWIFVNGHEFTTFYAPVVPTLSGDPAPGRIGLLATSSRDVHVLRTDERSLELEVEGGWLLAAGERIARDATPFQVGEQVDRPGFSAEVLEITPDGRPARVAFVFDEVLEHPSTRLLYFRDGAIELFEPGSVGSSQTLESNLPRPF